MASEQDQPNRTTEGGRDMSDQPTTVMQPVAERPPEPPAEVEVDYKPGMEAETAGIDQIPDTPAPVQAKQEAEDTLEVLMPQSAVKTYTLGPKEVNREYTQRPLSVIRRIQWFALIGEVLDDALSGDNAISLNSLFDNPMRDGNLSMEMFRNADTFVQAVGKLLTVAPDFLTRSLAIWLNVPDYERNIFTQLVELPEEEGGLTDDMLFEIVETFIDQNYVALDRFFREKLPALQRRVEQRAKEAAEAASARSKR